MITSLTQRALVLGGGGSTGNAWLIGVIAGLFEAGLDVTDADLTVGTSAGSTAAVQIAGTSPIELLAAILDAPPMSRPGSTPPVTDHLAELNALIAGAADAADMRRRVGAAALDRDAGSDGSWTARWRETVSARFPNHEWPERSVRITAVDARTGEPVVFDRNSGVDLVDAVAASCSSRIPFRIGDGRYIDGGYRRNENADLAAGYGRVLVLSPFGGRTRHPVEWGMDLATQISELRAGGSRVETVFPERAAGDVFNANASEPATRPQAARGGYDQGHGHLAELLAEFWR
jgi:NTE family protein